MHLLWALQSSVQAGDSPAYDKLLLYFVLLEFYNLSSNLDCKTETLTSVRLGSFIPGYMCILVVYSIFT